MGFESNEEGMGMRPTNQVLNFYVDQLHNCNEVDFACIYWFL